MQCHDIRAGHHAGNALSHNRLAWTAAVATETHEHVAGADREWPVELRAVVKRIERRQIDLAREANHAQVLLEETEGPPDGALARPQARGQSLAHDDGICVVARLKRAAGKQRDVVEREEVGTDRVAVDGQVDRRRIRSI